MKKEAIVYIDDFEYPNYGISYINNKKIKIKGVLPNQKVKVLKNKNKAKIVELLGSSILERKPTCDVFNDCGGCTYQNISYEYELELKKHVVLKMLVDKDISGYNFLGIEGSSQYAYRNKMEYSFGDLCKFGSLSLGLRKSGKYYEVVNSNTCNIVDSDFIKILFFTQNFFQNTTESFYNKKLHTGSLRHLVIRKGINTKEVLINLVTTSDFKTDTKKFVEGINNLSLLSKVNGILHTFNDSLSDTVKLEKMKILYGYDYYNETICGLKFKVYPMAFFQTNTNGAEILYRVVKEFILECEKRDIIYDLYCGTGTIAQVVSSIAEEVYGIDIIKESIQVAQENAKQNNVTNCRFYTGDVKDILETVGKNPDIIIVDPPREGLTPKAIKKVIALKSKYIVYISCKPSSFVTELIEFMNSGYYLKKLKLVDMFPKTPHVEAIGLLCLGDGDTA